MEEDFDFEAEENEEHGTPAWMVTYSDMVTLLLTFFVLLFSFAVVDALRFENAIKSFQGALGSLTMEQSILMKGEERMNKVLSGAMDLTEMEEFLKDFKDFVKEKDLLNVADVSHTEQGVVISLTDMLVFPSGSARLTARGKEVLAEVLPMVEKFPHDIQVIGHADNTRIRSREYPSNWELSFDRALSVKTFYTERNPALEKRFSVQAHAANKPLVKEGPDGVKRSRNRRVDLLFRRPPLEKSPEL